MVDPAEGQPEQVSTRVWRLPLPLPLAGLPWVNCYAILGDHDVTLIDPGWMSPETETALLGHLGRVGADPGDVRQVLVTHAHWDHYTQALDWQRRHGTRVLLGREEGHSIDRLDLSKGPHPAQAALLRRSGASALADTLDHLPLEGWEVDMPFSAPDAWLDDGDRVDCGGVEVTCVSTPGHTRGHMAYQLDDLVFTGDHILPRVTPSVGFEQAPEEHPLATYLVSLREDAERPDRRLLPAHGAVTASVRDRARALLAHHDARLAEVADRVAGGATTAFEVASGMTWTRRQLTLEELEPVHAMTAVLEVREHLELLAARGDLGKRADLVESYAA
ncbi:MAG: MBL fold metallo-hydrolase [Nocardioides sp.]|uniref:MBL fold metallo-hydrolase n=1 Tax=Nocardioides sp. TaxID=35761 RepID=UPI0039E60338